jgi:lysine-specific demethylase/histidyl-hydroxylase NO66
MTVLSALVGDVDDFFEKYVGKAPLHRRDVLRDLGAFVSIEDIDRVITGSGLRTPGVQLAKDGVVVTPDRYVSRSTLGYAGLKDVVDPVKVAQFYRNGATIVLGTVNLLLPRLHEVCKDIETELGHPVDANIYVAPPDTRAFDVHCDAQDILVIQVHGTKRWHLYDEIVPNPGGGTVVSGLDPDAPSSVCELYEGDLLYVPRGMPHLVRTTGSSSVHVTISVNTMTWADLLRELIQEILRADEFAVPLPLGRNVAERIGPMVGRYGELIASALAGRAGGDALHRTLYGRTAFGEPVRAGLLRQAVTGTPTGTPDRIRLRPGVWPLVTLAEGADGARITVGTSGFRVSARVAETCRRLLDGPLAVQEISPDPSEAATVAETLIGLGMCAGEDV